MYNRAPFLPPQSSPVFLGNGADTLGNLPRRSSAAAVPSDARFSPSPFQYNARVAVALVPCGIVLLGAGGGLVVGTLLIGLTISYILDALQFKQGAFVAIWTTFFTTAAAIAFSGVGFAPHVPFALSLLVLMSAMHLIFLSGVWVSLQFRWLQLEHPFVVMALERVLFACCPITAAAIQTWGLVSAVGILYAPFYLMPLLFGLFWLFSLPLPSSFRAKSERSFGGRVAEGAMILGPLEGCIHTLLLLFLPFAFHLAVHHNRFLMSVNESCDNLLLFFVPELFLLFASTRGALSWLIKDERALQRIRIFNGSFALAIVLGCLEIRVVFTSFLHYIHFPPPLNYLLVTTALFGIGFGAAAHFAGLLRGFVASSAVTALLLVSAVAGSLALGMPWKMLPAPAIAAAYLGHFYSSSSRTSYFIFAAAATLSAAWFVVHHFFFLSAAVGSVDVALVSRLLVAATALALALPGVALFPRSQPLVGLTAVVQAGLVCLLENSFYDFNHLHEGAYPPYLVFATSAAGFLFLRRLRAEDRIGPWMTWVASSLYFSKLAVLFLPSPSALPSAIVFVLAVSPPFVLYRAPRSSSSSSSSLAIASRMKLWQALLHIAAIFISIWFVRFTIFDIIQSASGRRPSHSLLVASLLLVASVACIPIVAIHHAHNLAARRAITLLLLSSLVFFLIRPPLPPALSAFWDASHYPDDDPDDISIYGEPITGPLWPAWLLLMVLMGAALGVSSALPIAQIEPLRLAYGIVLGSLSGIYVAAKYFEKINILVHLLLITACVLTTLFTVFTHHPTAWSPKLMPLTFALQVVLLPTAYLAVGRAKSVSQFNEEDEEAEMVVDFDEETRLESARSLLLGIFCAMFLIMALVIKFKLARALRDKTSGSAGSLGEKQLPNRSPFTAQHRNIQRRNNLLTAFASRKSWMPLVGNLATLLAFGLALFIAASFLESTDRIIFFIAPMLLLLNQDANILSTFGDRQRYFPLTVSVSIYLVFNSIYRLVDDTYILFAYLEWREWSSPLRILRNIVVLLMTFPTHAVFSRFMWDYAKVSDYILLVLAPLNVPALVVSDISAIQILGGVGLGYVLVQYLVSRHVRIAGLKYI